jgi:hypothetical protein
VGRLPYNAPTLTDPIRRRRDDLFAVAFLVITTTVLFADILFGVRALYIRDLTRYYYPTKRIIREVVLSGEFPYWNRNYSAGQPMAANPEYEVFYPPQWLIFLPNYDLGYRLHIVVHVYIAAIGMYAFLRSLSLGARASTLGALAFGLGGFFLSTVNLLPIMFCAAWMPLIFLFGRRCLLRPNWKDFALAALMLGVQMLTAEPTTLLQTWFLLGTYGLYRGFHAPERRLRATVVALALVAAMGTAGLMVGGAQMFGALDHAGESARARPFDFELISTWSMHYSRPLELLFPTMFGYIHREGGFYWASGLYKRTGSPFIFNIYMSIFVAAFALAAAVRRVKGSRYVLALCIFSYVIALGGNTPLLEFLHKAGIAVSIRYLEKFSLIGLFAVMVLGSQMADLALKGDRRVIRFAQAVVLLTGVVALGMAIFSFVPSYPDLFRKFWGLGATPKAMRMVEASAFDWKIAIVRAIVALGILELMRRGRLGRVASLVAGILIVVDMSVVTATVLPRMPARFFTEPPVARQFEEDRTEYRIFHEADWYGTSKTARSYFATGDAIYWIVRNGLFPMTPASWRFRTVLERDYDKTALLSTVDLVDAMWKVRDKGQKRWAEMFMKMSNAWYRGNYVELEAMRKKARGRDKEGEPIEFKRLDTSPARYYFADRVETIRDQKQFIEKLVAGVWTDRIAFVHTKGFKPAPGTVAKVTETANSAVIDVDASGPALLVMSVTPHKYWRFHIDGREARSEVVNIGYTGLRVPPGRHRIEMRYRNDVVFISAILSLISALILTVVAVAARRPEEPSAEPPVQEISAEVAV